MVKLVYFIKYTLTITGLWIYSKYTKLDYYLQ